jgi:hypothetical protein
VREGATIMPRHLALLSTRAQPVCAARQDLGLIFCWIRILDCPSMTFS